MPRKVQIYAITVICLGAVGLGAAVFDWTTASLDRFLVCLVLSLLGATFKVKLPGSDSSISPSFVPFLYALGTMSWQETMIMAAGAGVVQSIWSPKQRPSVLQILFNAAALALASGAAFFVSHSCTAPASLAMFLVAAVVFQVINVLIVAGVLCLLKGDSISGIWKNCHFWSFPYHLAGAALAAVWAQNDHVTAVGFAVLLCAGMLYLMSAFYAELVRRVAPPSLPEAH